MSLTLISPSWFTSSEQNGAQETDSQPSLKKDEPETIQEPEYVIRKALDAAGYYVGHIAVQGVWDEDKPIQPGGKWDASRVPHEEIAR